MPLAVSLLVKYKQAKVEKDVADERFKQAWALIQKKEPRVTRREVDSLVERLDFDVVRSSPNRPKRKSKTLRVKAINGATPLYLVRQISKSRKAVALGEVPKLEDRIIQVMGQDECGIKEVVSRLEKRGWLPDSKDPNQYINFMLNSCKQAFENARRGVYRVKTDPPKSGIKPLKLSGDNTKDIEKGSPMYRLFDWANTQGLDLSAKSFREAKDKIPEEHRPAWLAYMAAGGSVKGYFFRRFIEIPSL